MTVQQEEFSSRLLEQVSDNVTKAIKTVMVRPEHRDLAELMDKVIDKSEFYRQINEEMHSALKDVLLNLTTAPADGDADTGDSAEYDASRLQMLFTEVARQIEETTRTILAATVKIMATVELLIEQQTEAKAIIASLGTYAGFEKGLARLDQLNQSLASSLYVIIAEMSFQDLTGQRLEKMTSAIGSIRAVMAGLCMATGMTFENGDQEPEKELCEITAENRRAAAGIQKSKLKGPTMDASQSVVDDLLTEFGI